MKNSNFKAELVDWIRFNSNEASKKGDGIAGACMGSPSVPRWLGKHVVKFALNAKSENAKIAKQVGSSTGLVVFVSEKNDPKYWVEAGRAYERFALKATSLGVKNAFLNMPVEEASVRHAFEGKWAAWSYM